MIQCNSPVYNMLYIETADQIRSGVNKELIISLTSSECFHRENQWWNTWCDWSECVSFLYNSGHSTTDYNWLTGKTVVKMENQFKVGCVTPRPCDPDVFLCGGFSSEVKAWDVRSSKVSLITMNCDWSDVCVRRSDFRRVMIYFHDFCQM